MDSERIANRRRRRRRRKLQRLIPAAIAIVLIAVIATVGWKTGLFESFLYTSEEADLFSYFGAIGDDYAVIVEDGEITTRQMKVIDVYQQYFAARCVYNGVKRRAAVEGLERKVEGGRDAGDLDLDLDVGRPRPLLADDHAADFGG